MRKTAVFCLVVVVLLAGMTLPGVALQDGPPDPDDGVGDGPPDHANGGDDDDEDDDGSDGASDDESDDGLSVDEILDDGPPDDEGDGGEDDEGSDSASDDAEQSDSNRGDGDGGADADGADEEGDGGDTDADDEAATGDESPGRDDGRDDAAGNSEEGSSDTSSNDGGTETPSNPVTPLLPFFDDEEDEQQPDPDEESPGEESSNDSEDPLPVSDDEETETPESERTPSGEAGDDSGTEGSSDSSDGDGEPTVEISTSDSATVADVTNVEGGDTVEADLRGPATEGEHVAVESVDVRVEADGPFTLTATQPTGEAGEEAAPGVPVSYFDVETDAGVEQATLTLEVDESALPEGVQPTDVEVLRQTGDGWETTETTYHEDEGVYTAETSGFSTFAVAAPSAGPLEVTDAEVSENGGGSGENATAVATVENTGDRQATQTFAATVDGETVATRELTLDGGESATVTFDIPADKVQEGTVAVDGVEAGSLQVEETEDDGSPASSSSGNTAFGVGAAVFVVLSAVGTGLLAARHEEWDWEL